MKFYLATSDIIYMLQRVKFDGLICNLLCKFNGNHVIFQETRTHVYNYNVGVIDSTAVFNGCIEVKIPVFLKMLDLDYSTTIECIGGQWYISGKCETTYNTIKYVLSSTLEDISVKYLQMSDFNKAEQCMCSDITDAHQHIRSVCKQLEKLQVKDTPVTFNNGKVYVLSSNIIYMQDCGFASRASFSVPYSTYSELCKFLSRTGSNEFYYVYNSDYIDFMCGNTSMRINVNNPLPIGIEYSDTDIADYYFPQINRVVQDLAQFIQNAEITLYVVHDELQLSIRSGTIQYDPASSDFSVAMRITYMQLILIAQVFRNSATVSMSINGNIIYFKNGIYDLWIAGLVSRGEL